MFNMERIFNDLLESIRFASIQLEEFRLLKEKDKIDTTFTDDNSWQTISKLISFWCKKVLEC